MKTRQHKWLCLVAVTCLSGWLAVGQQSETTPAAARNSTVVPSLISYSGVLKDSGGRAMTAITGATFLLYKDQEGGARPYGWKHRM